MTNITLKYLRNQDSFRIIVLSAKFWIGPLISFAVRFRCIAVCSLGMWVCEELMQKNIHHQVKDAISVLAATLKVSDPARPPTHPPRGTEAVSM